MQYTKILKTLKEKYSKKPKRPKANTPKPPAEGKQLTINDINKEASND